MVGLIDDAKQVTRSFVTQAGQSILLIGGLPHELGGSYYLQTQFGKRRSRSRDRLVRGEKSSGLSSCSHFERIGPRRSRCFGGWAFGCLGGDAFGKPVLGFHFRLILMGLRVGWILCSSEKVKACPACGVSRKAGKRSACRRRIRFGCPGSRKRG